MKILQALAPFGIVFILSLLSYLLSFIPYHIITSFLFIWPILIDKKQLGVTVTTHKNMLTFEKALNKTRDEVFAKQDAMNNVIISLEEKLIRLRGGAWHPPTPLGTTQLA